MADDCLQPALKCHYQWIIKTSYFSSMKNNIDEKIKLLSKLYTADFVFFWWKEISECAGWSCDYCKVILHDAKKPKTLCEN